MAVAQVKLAVRAMGVKGKYLEVSAEKLLKYLEAEKSTHFLTEILLSLIHISEPTRRS